MKTTLTGSLVVTIIFLSGAMPVLANETGQQLFQKTCQACHSIGQGRRVGPDLKDVQKRRATDWIREFVKDSQAMIKSGDPQAVAISREFNGMIMPPHSLTTGEIDSLISYIAEASGSAAEIKEPEEAEKTPAPVSAEMYARGLELFQGSSRFTNNGPACNSCHHVKHDAVIGGGILARELTTVFSRMGEGGVASILGQAPFPVMSAAYQNRQLTEDEIKALVAFLQRADAEHAWQQPRDYGWGLFISGIVGSILLIGLLILLGRRRKKRSVNQDIYDRQIRSQ